MTWDNVLKIVTAALASVGGISAVIILAVKWSSGIIAKRLEERYSLKLSKELEAYIIPLHRGYNKDDSTSGQIGSVDKVSYHQELR